MNDDETDLGLRADEIHPTDATCSLSLFENSYLGIKPCVMFNVDVECEEIERDDDDDEFDGTLGIAIEGARFQGKSWRDLDSFHLDNVECFTNIDDPDISVYFDTMHRRMGRLTIEVIQRRGDLVDLRIAASEDIDDLGLDSFSVNVTATFTGVSATLTSKEVAVSDLIDLDGLVEGSPGHWSVPQ
ncbi:Hypothetical protein CGLY_14710 [Corynebacterium glyciniphilum AJ 3170]|uniref:Uncharacterized protein n=1 Tax=Corynebacterium glyciniphilum AJ 3170 TaxID=1404245 RepID=X5DQ81_9CORY|nr:hypothetical protein [Corynebacterium glyciniphilum]AHW65378.1 Hypothetical protein CGLY_14710 [Corynebacterium glyciniphilum AJ 3170]